jgi:formate hydrogenlyase subunit 3/multisubunit Na+/H+ antiporter MnhD subunit
MNTDTLIIITALTWAALLIPLLILAPRKQASSSIILCGILLGPLIGWIIFLLSTDKTTKTKTTLPPIHHTTPLDPMAQWEMQQRIKQGPPPPPNKTPITQ